MAKTLTKKTDKKCVVNVKRILKWIKKAKMLFSCGQDYIHDFDVFEPRGEANNVVFKIAWHSIDTENLTVDHQIVRFTERELSKARICRKKILHLLTKEKYHYYFEIFDLRRIKGPGVANCRKCK